MPNLVRNDPFGELEDLFKGFFVRPVQFENDRAAHSPIKLDVSEDDAAYTVHAEVPGVKKEDIHVSIDGNQLTISCEVKNQREDREGNRVLRSERYYGKVQRAIALPQDLDEAGAEAKYNDGVLELRLPKKAATSAKRITIQ